MPLPEKVHADREDTDHDGKGDGRGVIEHVGHLEGRARRNRSRLSFSYFGIETGFVEKPIDLSILGRQTRSIGSFSFSPYNFRTHQVARGRIADIQRWSIVLHREKSPEKNEHAENGWNGQQGIVPAEPGEIEGEPFTVIISNGSNWLHAEDISKLRPTVVQFLEGSDRCKTPSVKPSSPHHSIVPRFRISGLLLSNKLIVERIGSFVGTLFQENFNSYEDQRTNVSLRRQSSPQ